MIDEENVITASGENSVMITWLQPCGLGNVFAYSLVGNIDGEDVDLSISSPHSIENLSWSTTYNLEVHTLSEYGESFSPLDFSITKGVVSIIFVSIIMFLFYSLWGLNYFKTPLLSKLDIGEVKYESLQTTLTELINDVNQIHLLLGDENITINDLEFDKEKTLSELKLNNVKKFNKIPTTKFVKKSIFSKLYLYQGVSGYINPFTLEAIVVKDIPSIDFSITVLHEQAHQLGYAAEGDANFLAFISSINNQDPLIKYSGYVFGLTYLLNEIQINHKENLSLFIDKINPGIIEDINSRRKFWAKNSNNIINDLQSVLYDFYLKSNNQKSGMRSYSRIVNHIINYYENDKSLYNY